MKRRWFPSRNSDHGTFQLFASTGVCARRLHGYAFHGLNARGARPGDPGHAITQLDTLTGLDEQTILSASGAAESFAAHSGKSTVLFGV